MLLSVAPSQLDLFRERGSFALERACREHWATIAVARRTGAVIFTRRHRSRSRRCCGSRHCRRSFGIVAVGRATSRAPCAGTDTRSRLPISAIIIARILAPGSISCASGKAQGRRRHRHQSTLPAEQRIRASWASLGAACRDLATPQLSEGLTRFDLLDAAGPLARIHLLVPRLSRMHLHGWAGKKASASIAHAWFVFDRENRAPAIFRHLHWRDAEKGKEGQEHAGA